jgi:hypothetical protein
MLKAIPLESFTIDYNSAIRLAMIENSGVSSSELMNEISRLRIGLEVSGIGVTSVSTMSLPSPPA